MLISDVLREKGRTVVMVRPTDSVAFAVRKFAEHHIGAVGCRGPLDEARRHFCERHFGQWDHA